MREFADELTVLSRWLGRDVGGALSSGQPGSVPVGTAFRFRDAAVFQLDEPECMYLVRGDAVREFGVSQVAIDEVYAELAGRRPAAA